MGSTLKKKTMFKLFHLIVATIVLVCNGNGIFAMDSFLHAQLSTGNQIFAGKLAHELLSQKPDKSFIVSSLSALLPFAQLAVFSKERVLEELLKLLNVQNKDQITDALPLIVAELKRPKNVTMTIATKFYANIGNPLSQNFICDSKTYFDADGETLDFSKNHLAADNINKWVAKKTDDMITNIVTPNMFNSNTRLVLANAISLTADWLYPFDVHSTYEAQFTKVNGHQVTVKMMYQTNDFNYYAQSDFQVLEMFYVGKDISFLTILPNDANNLLNIAKSLSDPDFVIYVMENLSPTKIEVKIPKFELTSRIDLKDVLKKNGVTAIFQSGTTGLEDILENKESIHVTDALQVARIIVDEVHTQAAAATVVIAGLKMSPQYNKMLSFNADRPFVFSILNRRKRVMLFNGFYNGPQ
ncbi:antichymotrypsin-2-like [Spodoptera litura]|uniref:Antichymotrypsin-2-like n=1 Tax=Spodoptera litura TaxID=69820 RepID=A0A9J7IJJ0_SPOLT|nr:antichymotrypsin-2-like [Spodoptera litura]